MDIVAFRAGAQAFATELGQAHLQRFSGRDGRWDPHELHARHADLWSDEAIAVLRAEPPSDGARRLLRFAVEGRLGRHLAALDAERVTAESQEDLAGMRAALAETEDPRRRAEIEEHRLEIVRRRITPLAAQALERVRAEARALGWPSARAMFCALHGTDLGALAARAEALLRAAPPPHLDLWVHARQDLPRWLRLARDGATATPALPALRDLLARLGLTEDFAVDAEPRDGRSPRAFCAAIRVPDDIVLVAADDDAGALFHEGGHALHLTHRDPRAPFEERHLVDRATAEGFAFLLEQAAPAPPDPLRARRVAASVVHDLELLDAGPVPALAERYARRMAHATGLDWPQAAWLAASDPLLGSADYLRGLEQATALAAQLGGARWWETADAGPRLAALLSAPAEEASTVDQGPRERPSGRSR